MKAEEFSVWFAGVGRRDADQRGKVVAALAKLYRGRGEQERARETGAPAAGATGQRREARSPFGRFGNERP